MAYYTKSINQTLEELNSNDMGLSTIEAEELINRYGLNEVKIEGTPLWKKIVEPFASVFMLILFIAALISFIKGEIFESIVIVVIIASSAIIYYVQQISTDRILRALQKHSILMIDVMRDHRYIEIDATQLVPGDIIIVREGDKVPADARIMTSNSLRVDESQLTGESTPVTKQSEKLSGNQEIYEQNNCLFQGSFVISGEARAIVTATGNDTEFGRLAVMTTGITDESPVQTKIDKLVNQIIVIIAILSAIAFALSLYRGTSFGDSLSFVLALAVSAVPESLPVAISIVLAFGMRRMAAKKALVRNMSSIETIGIVTTIATDKTGTLTKNKLEVLDTWQPKNSESNLDHIISKSTNINVGKIHDPLDVALSKYVHTDDKNMPAQVIPFDTNLSISGNIWQEGNSHALYLKGSPEAILERSDITKEQHDQAISQLEKLSSNGYRVIGFAHLSNYKEDISIRELEEVNSLNFDGFIAVADSLRPEAKIAIKRAIDAGVTVRMITGDHFETAYHIARELGMVSSRNQVFDSRLMNKMGDDELESIIDNIRVFSRVIPEHKYRILTILKKKNITAMTGDGVNDVPALTNAHVGIAMGSGTTIAREAGDIILMDDNFKSVVEAIHEGRTIYANIKRMLVYLLSTNAGEVIVSIGALIVGMPIPLSPVQILWVNLVTDSLTVIPLGLEPGEKRNMKRGPQKPNAPLLSKFMITRVIIIALTMGILTLLIYAHYLNKFGENYARTMAFCVIVVMQWASMLCARSDYEPLIIRIKKLNLPLLFGLLTAVALQFVAMFSPLGKYLNVSTVTIGDIFIVSLISFVIPIIVIEIHKLLGRAFFNKGSKPIKIKMPF